MKFGVLRIVGVAVASLLWLTACETTSPKLPDIFGAKTDAADPMPTGSVSALPPSPDGPPAIQPIPPFTPSDPHDDLSLGKTNFRQGNYGLAERYFRRSAEAGPNDAESWLGLAATYDRLRRFDLADRAYGQVIQIAGQTPEILNNQGYSMMLRGDYPRARQILQSAQAKDPSNPYIKNNLDLLDESVRTRKAVR
jgi:tetratricopeptide (TPR) repeat protein